MFATLSDFISALESEGQLKRISPCVSPLLEVTEIADRVSKSPAAVASEHASAFDPHHAHLGGHALLFENIQGSSFPLLINAFGSYSRMELALGCRKNGFQGLADKIQKLVKPEPPSGLIEKLKKIPELAKIASYPPKVVRHGICQQVVKTGDAVDLFSLPIIKCWPLDGDPRSVGYPVDIPAGGGEGRFITFGGVHTILPVDAGKAEGLPRTSRNVGMYRAQVLDKNHTAMHWHVHHDGARHWRAWKKHLQASGERGDQASGGNRGDRGMPLAIALGGESVLPYAATSPLPPGISELLFAGFLNDGPIEMVKCKTVDLHVPANSEIIIEGYVSTEGGCVGYDPRTDGDVGPGSVFEGPFGDHTGFYSLPDRYPIFEVTAITHRENAIYPTTIVGMPPQEDYYMGKATERVFLPLLQTIVPDVLDYDLPMFGAFHNCAFLKIRKEYPLQARRVMHAIWGAGQMAWTKMLVVVDADVDVHDYQAVMFHVCANCDPGRDIEIVNGPLDILDHASPRLGAGHKIGFDATAKIKGEEVGGHPVRDWPPKIVMEQAVKDLVDKRWAEYGLGHDGN